MNKLLNKSIEYGLYFLVFLLPWQTRWIVKSGSLNDSYSEYNTYSLYGTDIILGAIFILFLILFIKGKKESNDKKIPLFLYALALFDAIAFISVFTANNHYLATYKYLSLLMAIGLFFLIIRFPYNIKRLLSFFGLSIVIQASIGIYQFLTQLSPGNKWLGVAEHIPYDAGVSVVEAMGSLGFVERWLRSYGALPHPNILGGFLTIGIIVITIYYVKRRKETHFLEDDEIIVTAFKENVLYNIFLISAVVALFFSFSRSAWLSAVLFFFLFLLVSLMKKDFLAQKYLLTKLLFVGIILFVISYPFMNLIEVRVESRGRIERISQTERATSSSLAIRIIKDRWALGTGFGNYTETVHRDYVLDKKGFEYQPVHNTFLLIATELGVFGLIAFLFLLLSLFFYPFSWSELLYRLPFFVAFIILLYYDHWLWSLHFGVLYFWLIMGLMYRIFSLDNIRPDVV